MALDTLSDYVLQARILIQDQVQPYRYPDGDLVLAFNLAVMESRKLRPDLWLNVSPLPSFYFAQVSTSINAGGTVLTFPSVPYQIAAGMQMYDVTNPGALSPAQLVSATSATTITMAGGGALLAVNSGDVIACILPSLIPNIDVQYRMPFVYFMCGQAQMRDEEETEDNRALYFMKLFQEKLVGF